MNYPKDFLVGLYQTMLRIRLCEESLVEPILKGIIRCPVHLYSGEEAVATGLCAALEKMDYVFGNHRSHGHYLAKGGSMKAMVAEIYGKESGTSKGRGGSMHLIDPENNVLGVAPIVAGTISLAMGAALSAKIRNNKRISVSFFGDGATGEGVLYESMNFASLKKLPIIFACENNFYSTHLPIKEIRTNQAIYESAQPFTIPAYRIDGNNVLDVYETSLKAVEHCRSGKGPVFIEFLTYRFRGHVGPDDNIQGKHTDIRPKNEIDEWLKKDPLTVFKNYMLNQTICTEQELQVIMDEVKKEVAEANAFAASSKQPPQEELKKYVYAK